MKHSFRVVLLICVLVFALSLTAMAVTIVVEPAVNLRRSPNTHCEIIGVLHFGDMFAPDPSKSVGDWTYGTPGEQTAIYQEFGRVWGYVKSEFLYTDMI